MSEELAALDAELEDLFREIREHLAIAKKMKIETDFQEKTDFIKDRLKRSAKVISGYKVELRYIKKMNDPLMKEKVAKFEGTQQELQAELDWAEKERSGGAPQNKDEMTADDLLKKGERIQQTDMGILTGALQTVEQDKAIGVEILAHMSDQRDRLENANDHLEHMESSMRLASREMRVIAKRLMTDKLIMAVIVLIVLGIIAVVVMAIVKPSTKTNINVITNPTTSSGKGSFK
eukprot:m51a1_g14734 hypothetical protein (234) ;mRNA; f:236662-237677